MLRELEFEYILCFGSKVKLVFEPEFNIMVIGKWKNQKHRSNWSGKSSLLEVIKFLLYGETRGKYVKEIPNDNYDKPAKVSGVIQVGKKRLRISREVSGSSTKLDVEGWSSVDKKVLQERLNNLLGYDYKDFVSTSFFNQGEIHQFMEAKSSEKLTLLEKWMEIISWEECEATTKEKKKKIQSKLSEIEELIQELPELKSELSQLNKNVEEVEKEIEEASEKDKELSKEIDKLRWRIASKSSSDLPQEKKDAENELFKLGSLRDAEREVQNIEKEIRTNQSVIDEAISNIPELKRENKKRVNLCKDLELKRDTFRELNRSVQTIQDRVEQIGEEISCPIDGEECSREKEIRKYKREQKQRLRELQKKRDKVKAEVDSLSSKVSGLELSITEKREVGNRAEKCELKIETFKEKKRRAESKIKDIKELQKKLKRIKEELSKKTKSTKIVNELQKEFEEKNSELEKVKEEMRESSENLGRLKRDRQETRDKLKEVKAGEKRLSLLNERKEILTFCSLMFGKSGIRSSQLRSRIENIERETNLILDELDSKLQIEIYTERELGSWEPECIYCGREFPKGYSKRKCDSCDNLRRKRRKEEFDIKIVNSGMTRSWNQESGGVHVIVSLALRLSLVKLRQRVTGKSMSILFLDEIYGMLDAVNREQVYRLLLDYAKNNLGFKQIFQITHIDDGRTEGDVIEVTRRRRFSEVSWA